MEWKRLFFSAEGEDVPGWRMALLNWEKRRARTVEEPWFRDVLRSSPVSICTTDLRLRYRTVLNPPFGLRAEQMTGRTDEQLPGCQDVFQLVRLKQSVIETRAGARREILVRFNGLEYALDVTAEPAVDEHGRMIGLNVISTDVTESHRTIESLRLILEDLNRAQAVSHTGNWRLDVLRDELHWSDETYRMFGIARIVKMTYEKFLERVHPDDRAFVDDSWNAALAGKGYDIEHRIIVDGTVKWVRERAELDFDEKGALLGGFGTVQDITTQKEIERALCEVTEQRERHSKQLEAILENLTEGVLVSDLQGNLIHWNPAALKMHGFDNPEDYRLNVADFDRILELADTAGAILPVEQWPLNRVLRGENLSAVEIRIRRRDRPDWQRVFLCGGALVQATGGIPLMAVLTVSDMTSRYEAEKSLKASLLEKEVLLKEIHHRVKNNLQVISSLVSLQACSSQDAAVREGLMTVCDRVTSMAFVHENLYRSPEMSSVDFGQYAAGVLKSLWHVHGAVAAGHQYVLNAKSVKIPVDKATPCGLILNELVINALKHAWPQGPGRLTVSVCPNAAGRFCLKVADDGKGFPSSVDWMKGSTLGLRLVQMLSKQLEATVEMNSTPGQGTECIVTFSL